MSYRVVWTDHVYPDLDLERRELEKAGATLDFIDSREEAVIAKAARDADALVTCYAEIMAGVISGMERCKSISKTGIGVNNICLAQAEKQGIFVMNVPDYCIEEVSDHTVALMLSLTRRVPFLAENVAAGNWSLEGCRGITRLRGKAFGLLGFGRIARLVAEKVQPYGMELLVYDPYVAAEAIAGYGGRKVELDEVLQKADVLSLNLPLTPETDKMINDAAIAMMKPGVILVNTSRGGLVDEAALARGLASGQVGGAGLDVLAGEQFDAGSPLFGSPNLVVTPHAAFYSVESTRELREKILADVIAVMRGEQPKYRVR